MKIAKSGRILSLLALVLVAAMMLTMVGCGGKDPEPQQPDNVATQPTDQVTDPTDGGETDAIVPDATEPDATEPSADGVTDPTEPSATEPGDDEPTSGSTTKPIPGSTTAKPSVNKPQGTTKPSPSKTLRPQKTSSTTKKTTTTKKQINYDNLFDQIPSDLKGTKIKMLIWWNSGTDDKSEAAIFKKETGIEVTYETAAMDKYQNNLAGKVMAQNSPALAAIINEWYPQPITRGLMQPLTNLKNWNFKDEDIYSKSMMDQFGYKGKHYAIALKGSNMSTFEVMFFNKKILANQGVDKDPYQLWKAGNWNWDTCLQIAQKCTDEKKGLKGITNTSQFFWMLSAGQDFVMTDPKKGLSNNIKSTKLLDAWNWNWDLINTYKVIDTTYTAATPFFQGKAAMFGGGSYMMQAEASHQNYVPQNMKDDWGVVPFPSPKGNTVAACEGTVWGFPAKVTGKKLDAAAWYLRYFLDDYTYSARNFYPSEECWEVMDWMWDQKIQSYNSVGVLCYGGEYTAWSIQYSLVDEADTKAKMKSNLDTWYSVLDANIKKIESELE